VDSSAGHPDGRIVAYEWRVLERPDYSQLKPPRADGASADIAFTLLPDSRVLNFSFDKSFSSAAEAAQTQVGAKPLRWR
jgi:hypothetical protein